MAEEIECVRMRQNLLLKRLAFEIRARGILKFLPSRPRLHRMRLDTWTAIRRRIGFTLWIGHNGVIAMIVEQFGFAMIPLCA